MPNIREYRAQTSAETGGIPQREARGTDFGGTGLIEAGKAVTDFGSSVGHAQRIVYQNKARQEVTDADISLAKLTSELTTEMTTKERNWKPGDPSISESMSSLTKSRIDELAGGDVDKFETSVGRQHFQTKAAALAAHMVQSSSVVESRIAGVQAVTAHRELVDTQANFLYNNPVYFQFTRKDVEDTIRNPNGIYAAIPGQQREQMVRLANEQLAMSAAQGFIRARPNLALEVLQDPANKDSSTYGWISQYIPNEKYNELVNQARTVVHSQTLDQDRQHKEAEWARQESARTISSSLMAKLVAHEADPGKNPALTYHDLLNSRLQDYDDTKFKSLEEVIHTRANERLKPVVTDPTIERQLFDRITLPGNDPRKITDELPLNQAYVNKQLTWESFQHLRAELDSSRTPGGAKIQTAKKEFFDGFQSSITKSNQLLNKIDMEGDQNFYRFRSMVHRKVEEYQQAGKTPHDLFDPNKPDFLGTPDRLRPFQKTLQQSIKTMADKIKEGNKTLPDQLPEEQRRKPGESYGEWKARQK